MRQTGFAKSRTSLILVGNKGNAWLRDGAKRLGKSIQIEAASEHTGTGGDSMQTGIGISFALMLYAQSSHGVLTEGHPRLHRLVGRVLSLLLSTDFGLVKNGNFMQCKISMEA